MHSMTDKLNRDTTSWKPKPGDTIAGKLAEIEIHEGKFGTYPLLVLETEDGSEVSVHCFHTVLRSELARKRPQPGDLIGIKYIGDVAGKGYQLYKVRVERATPAPGIDYEKMAKQAADDRLFEGIEEPPQDVDYYDESE